MKKICLSLTILLFACTGLFAQKYGYVEMKTVLDQLPEYKSVTQEIERLAQQYNNEVESKLTSVQNMYDEYQRNINNLSSAYRKSIEDEIIRKEKEANDFQESIFGRDGELARRQRDMMRPIEARVNKALSDVAAEKGMDMIFDVSGDNMIVYKNENGNVTQALIQKLK